MLCAKYDYKMDIAVKQEEAREEGISIGASQKAIEDAIGLYENGVSVEIIAKSLKMTPERVLEIVNTKETQNVQQGVPDSQHVTLSDSLILSFFPAITGKCSCKIFCIFFWIR